MTFEEFTTILTEYAHNTGKALWDLEESDLRLLQELAGQLLNEIDVVLGEDRP